MDKSTKISLANMKKYKKVCCEVSKTIFSRWTINYLWTTVLVFLFIPLSIYAQSEKDNQLWQGQLNLINLEAIYKVTPLLRMAGGYRFSLMPIVDRHRLYVEPILRYEIKERDLKVWLHTKLQYEFDKKQNNTAHIRPLLFVKYEPKFPDRIEPFLSTELFYRISPDANPDQFRIYTGLDYKLTKEITFRLAYIRARELKVEIPLRTNIFFAQLNIEIDRPKKKS